MTLALALVLDVPHVRDDEYLPRTGVLPHVVIKPDHSVPGVSQIVVNVTSNVNRIFFFMSRPLYNKNKWRFTMGISNEYRTL
jgi:hypothetical protein